MKYALGIDPGQTGGIALVREDLQEAHAWRYPEDERERNRIAEAVFRTIRQDRLSNAALPSH